MNNISLPNGTAWEHDTKTFVIDSEGNHRSIPPVGLIPQWVWIEQRINEIFLAVNRYVEVGKEIPLEWIKEYNKLIKEYNKLIDDWRTSKTTTE